MRTIPALVVGRLGDAYGREPFHETRLRCVISTRFAVGGGPSTHDRPHIGGKSGWGTLRIPAGLPLLRRVGAPDSTAGAPSCGNVISSWNMKPRTYIETTIVSYLTARMSRDLVRAGEQEITREWWDRRATFDLYVSQLVLEEAAGGDPDAAKRRLVALQDLQLLQTSDEAIELGRFLLAAGSLPAKAGADALHIAVAAVHGMHYLLSWNCAHIANAMTRRKIESACRRAGYDPPMLCTPRELMEVSDDEIE